ISNEMLPNPRLAMSAAFPKRNVPPAFGRAGAPVAATGLAVAAEVVPGCAFSQADSTVTATPDAIRPSARRREIAESIRFSALLAIVRASHTYVSGLRRWTDTLFGGPVYIASGWITAVSRCGNPPARRTDSFRTQPTA